MNALILAAALLGATASVDDYVPMGATQHHDAIKNAATAAGEDGTVLFTAGQTYVLGKQVGMWAGQTWETTGEGSPAVIVRADELLTTLTAAAPAGATSIQVASTASWTNKHYLSPVLPGGGLTNGEQSPTRVTTVASGTLYLNRALSQAYPAGSPVVNTMVMIRMAAGARLENLEIDGNAAGNNTFVSWPQHNDVMIESGHTGATVDGVIFTDAQGNAIYCVADDVTIQNCEFEGANLAAIHIGGTVGLDWLNNDVIDVCKQAIRGGHSEGAITISQDNHTVLISGGSFVDCDQYAIARQHAGDNYNFTITGVYFSGNAGIYDGRTKTGYSGNLGLLFEDCQCVDSGSFDLEGFSGQRLSGAAIINSTFEDSDLNVTAVDDLEFAGVEFTGTAQAHFEDSSIAPCAE